MNNNSYAAKLRALVDQPGLVKGYPIQKKILLLGLLTNSHLLYDGVPGTAKTTLAKSLSQAFALNFGRMQFTPDSKASDITGFELWNPKLGEFVFVPGFANEVCNVLLADEINRAPAKTQSGLLEAMAERQVTVAGKTRKVADPFLVVATQNPIDGEQGTFALTFAQLDRFVFSVPMPYAEPEDELNMLADPRVMLAELSARAEQKQTLPAMSLEDLLAARAEWAQVVRDCSPIVDSYIVRLIRASRAGTKEHAEFLTRLAPYTGSLFAEQVSSDDLAEAVALGASARAAVMLKRAACAEAYYHHDGPFVVDGNGKSNCSVSPTHVQAVLPYLMRHRISLTRRAIRLGLTSEQFANALIHPQCGVPLLNLIA